MGLVVISTARSPIQASSSEMPDLRVVDISVSQDTVDVGDPFLLTAAVANFGGEVTCNVSVTFATGARTLEVISLTPDRPVARLAPGESVLFQASLCPREAGEYQVGVAVMVGYQVVAPPSEWLMVQATMPGSTGGGGALSTVKVIVPTVAFALVLGWYVSGSARRRTILPRLRYLASVPGRTWACHHSLVVATCILSASILAVLFLPHLLPSSCSEAFLLWFVRLHYPVFIIFPIAAVTTCAVTTRRPFLAFMVGLLPYALLGLFELACSDWRVYADSLELILVGISVGTVGAGASCVRSRNRAGWVIGILGLIVWFTICHEPIYTYIGFWRP